MMLILFKTSIVIVVILGFYKLLIEKESFFATNRIYLIAGLLFTFSLPFVTLPKLIENQGVVSNLIETTKPTEVNSNPTPLNTSIPETSTNNNSAEINPSVENSRAETTPMATSSYSVMDWLFFAYLFGVIVLSINLIAQILNLLFKVRKSKDKIRDSGSIIINTTKIKEPCSFFHYIFINPEQYEFEIYEQIIAHEKIHVKKRHSIDLLLSEIAVIVLWFNPFI